MSKYIKALILFLAGLVLVACCVFLFNLMGSYIDEAKEVFIGMGTFLTGAFSLLCLGLALALCLGAFDDW